MLQGSTDGTFLNGMAEDIVTVEYKVARSSSFVFAQLLVRYYTNTTWLEEKYDTILSRGTDNESIITNPQGEG